MLRFKKGYNLRVVISLIVSTSFLFTTNLYSYPDSKDALRVPVGQKSTYDRIIEVIRSYDQEEHKVTDKSLESAHQEGRVQPLYEARPDVITIVHQFLQANGLGAAIPLLIKLQEDGLWLVTPKKGEPLPLEHTSDKGIHIVDFPDEDIAKAYAHAIAAYIGLPHWMARPFEEAFAEWRNTTRLTTQEKYLLLIEILIYREVRNTTHRLIQN
jgi:hypothetical protein